MARQPSYRPLEATEFFPDKRSSRLLVPGTIARGEYDDFSPYFTGRMEGATDWGQAAGLIGVAGTPASSLGFFAAGDPWLDYFPVAVDAKLLKRGQERFNIYCSMCHDRAGTGKGMVVERGFATPPSFLSERLRNVKPGYVFNVISNGFGAMPDYASQIKTRDRWAIVAYVKALQLNAKLDSP